MRKNCEKWRKMSPRRPKKDRNHFCWRSPRTPAGWSFKLEHSSLSILVHDLITLGGGPPRIETLRGPARGSNLEALPQQGHIFPNAARKCPQPAKKHPNPSKFHPKLSPNLTQILPRPPRNRAKRPLGAHVGPMFEKSKILNVRNTSKSRPRASRRYPRPSQTLPKWGPRPSKIHFSMHFLVVFFQLQICVEFWLIFCYLSKAQHTKNNGFSWVKCYILQNCHL